MFFSALHWPFRRRGVLVMNHQGCVRRFVSRDDTEGTQRTRTVDRSSAGDNEAESAAQKAVEVESKVQERTQDVGEGRAHDGSTTTTTAEALYSRSMPGGGHVRVELVRASSAEYVRGRVVIDGRTPAPVTPEEELVVEEVEGEDQNLLIDRLFGIACDNAAIARRLLRRVKGATAPTTSDQPPAVKSCPETVSSIAHRR
jgi:hypothetical protein